MKNKFGELFSIKQPFDIKTTEDTSAESLTQKILVVMRDNIDNAIVGEIVKTATAEGVTDLAILNKAENIKAHEKQIPKKAIREVVEIKSEVKQGYIRYLKCPNCKRNIDEENTVHFCTYCGQAIDWSDEE